MYCFEFFIVFWLWKSDQMQKSTDCQILNAKFQYFIQNFELINAEKFWQALIISNYFYQLSYKNYKPIPSFVWVLKKYQNWKTCISESIFTKYNRKSMKIQSIKPFRTTALSCLSCLNSLKLRGDQCNTNTYIPRRVESY